MKRALGISVAVMLLYIAFMPAVFAGEMKTVKYCLPRGLESLEDMPMWTAVDQGYFEQEGILFEMEQAFGTSDIRMVAANQAQFCAPSPNLILASIEAGIPAKAVCAYDAINIFGMAVRSDSDVKTWQDLKGKTIALGDAAWAIIAAPTLAAAGLDPDKDVEYIVAGDGRYQMVNEKKIDVLFTWVSEFQQLKGQGFDFIYLDGEDVVKVLSNPVVTSLTLIETDPELVTRFTRALMKGMYFVYCSPEAAADIVLNRFPAIQIGWDGALAVARGRKMQNFGTTEAASAEIIGKGLGYMPPEKWAEVMQLAEQVGVISKPLPAEKVYTNEFVDITWDKSQVEADAKAYVFTSQVYKDAHK